MTTEIRKENEAFQTSIVNKAIEYIKWVETTEEHYWEMLECLPPEIMVKSGFLVGEPANHRTCKLNGCIKPVFDGFKKIGNGLRGEIETFFATSEPVSIPEFKALMEAK